MEPASCFPAQFMTSVRQVNAHGRGGNKFLFLLNRKNNLYSKVFLAKAFMLSYVGLLLAVASHNVSGIFSSWQETSVSDFSFNRKKK